MARYMNNDRNIIPNLNSESHNFLEPQVTQYGNHMVMTNVNKPRKTKYINIDTRFTDEYVYPHKSFNSIENYVMTLPEKINDVRTIRVRSVEIPMSFYNISTSLGNNYLKIGTKMAVLDDGNYTLDSTSSSLESSLGTKISGSGISGVTVAQQTISNTTKNGYINLTSSSVVEIDFNTDICGNDDKYNFRSKLGWLLGYRDPSYNLTSTALVAPSAVNLNTVRYMYLVVDEYSNSFPNSFVSPQYQHLMNKKILARISIDTNYKFGTVLHGNEVNGVIVSDVRSYHGKIDIQRLNIQLVNEWGKPMNLNGQDFSFVLEVEYE
jgi:hypothetical protein